MKQSNSLETKHYPEELHVFSYLLVPPADSPSLFVPILSIADREGCVLLLLLSVYKSVFVQGSIVLQGNSRCSPAHLYTRHTKLMHVDTATVTHRYDGPTEVHFIASVNPQAAAEASNSSCSPWKLGMSHCLVL